MKHRYIYCAAVLLLSGCTTLPAMPDGDDAQSIIQLADIVQCEILTTFKQAKEKTKLDFSKWGATYVITQNTTETDNAHVDPLTWLAPAGVTKLLYASDAKREREAYRNGKVEYSVPVVDDKSQACERVGSYKNIRVEPRDFRLSEWVERISHGENYGRIDKFSYSVRVQVTTKLGIGSEFEDGKWTAIGAVSRNRETVKTVDFAFAQRLEEKPVEVVIVDVKTPRQLETIVPGQGPATGPAEQKGPSPVPQSIIRQNQQSIQGLQLDRVSPTGRLDR